MSSSLNQAARGLVEALDDLDRALARFDVDALQKLAQALEQEKKENDHLRANVKEISNRLDMTLKKMYSLVGE